MCQGWDWWLLWLFNKQPKGTKRPKLVVMGACTNVVIRGIRAENSPSFHFDLSDSDNLLVDGVTVHVDVEKQRHMLAQAGMLSEAVSFGPPTVIVSERVTKLTSVCSPGLALVPIEH